MDVSLRHWPIFATGLLLGAAGTMSLGLHRPTQAELAAAAAAATPAVAQSVVTPAALLSADTVAPAGTETASAESAGEQLRLAAEAFRKQEVLAAAAMPVAVALAGPPKPRVRRVVREEVDVQAVAAPGSPAPAMAIAPTAAPQPSEAVARPRSATSMMGAAPEGDQARPQPE